MKWLLPYDLTANTAVINRCIGATHYTALQDFIEEFPLQGTYFTSARKAIGMNRLHTESILRT